ncbi:ATP-binding Cassette (ABC) Superfamily [Phytophthora cinnamomi]|uniref:ATP-binding Cassette (ABC) Superfamily n=1 Tax=Phytophthora cinnamomi TaxID=4785 RepID=UPI00355A1B65|nr:ATP-binding Cassette (ABC) Superfamily [Phytophthora cinnamomi]
MVSTTMPPCSKLPREASGGLNEEDTSFLSFMLDTSPTRASVRKWPEDLKAQRKMELHSKRMARFRSRKTTELHMMQNEHKRLDRELEDRIDALRRAGVCGASLVQNELQRLVLEREMLRQESIELQQEIAKHLKFQQIIQSSSETLVPRVSPANCLSNCKSNVGSFTVRRIESLWTPVEGEAGRHVEFTGGEPPFFFHPFSR